MQFKSVTAPEEFNIGSKTINVFLAGGICKCWEWQKAVISHLQSICSKDVDNEEWTLCVLNPRRDNFPIITADNQDEIVKQITWEYNAINNYCNIFSMYFCNSESDQPICMYELGSQIGKHNVPIIISVENGYSREKDVEIQIGLAKKSIEPEKLSIKLTTGISNDELPKLHASMIYDEVLNAIKRR